MFEVEYWRVGSGKSGFFGLVNNFIGKFLLYDVWVKEFGEDVEEFVKSECEVYEKFLVEVIFMSDVDLDMRMLFVYGDEVIVDSVENGGFLLVCVKFKSWIYDKWLKIVVV